MLAPQSKVQVVLLQITQPYKRTMKQLSLWNLFANNCVISKILDPLIGRHLENCIARFLDTQLILFFQFLPTRRPYSYQDLEPKLCTLELLRKNRTLTQSLLVISTPGQKGEAMTERGVFDQSDSIRLPSESSDSPRLIVELGRGECRTHAESNCET